VRTRLVIFYLAQSTHKPETFPIPHEPKITSTTVRICMIMCIGASLAQWASPTTSIASVVSCGGTGTGTCGTSC